jgi:hypothetical protein
MEMGRRRLALPAVLLAGVCLAAVIALRPAAVAAAADALPERLGDAEFWTLIGDLSEPDGNFPFDNFLSNETTIQSVIPALKVRAEPGGAYLGVGPEQNFTYIAALRPRIAFIIDIRRQNMLEHLLYKALIELSSDRAEFLSRLFSRTRLAGVGTTSTVDELFAAARRARSDRGLFQRNLKAVRTQLIDHYGFTLGSEDLDRIEYVYNEFYVHGPDLRYSLTGVSEEFPAYAELMAETDDAGERHGYLATEQNFRFLKELERNNLIVPLVGDFAGPKALRAVGRYLKEHGATVSVFYTSNVEQYLRPDGAWGGFCSNVATLPLDTTSTFIRTVTGPRLGGQEGQYALNPELGNIAGEVGSCGSSDRPR